MMIRIRAEEIPDINDGVLLDELVDAMFWLFDKLRQKHRERYIVRIFVCVLLWLSILLLGSMKLLIIAVSAGCIAIYTLLLLLITSKSYKSSMKKALIKRAKKKKEVYYEYSDTTFKEGLLIHFKYEVIHNYIITDKFVLYYFVGNFHFFYWEMIEPDKVSELKVIFAQKFPR